MALTRSFKATVQACVQRDPGFREALLTEGVDALLAGDVATGKAVLRDFIKATVGFEKLASATGAPPKGLMRMFSPAGNPSANNLFPVLGQLQQESGVYLHAQSGREAAPT
ncbi:MAG: transcriptional regulator [Caulobacteraceae bacterium]|nr:transcriptional regulator [Caulobacteraceae bacterium]